MSDQLTDADIAKLDAQRPLTDADITAHDKQSQTPGFWSGVYDTTIGPAIQTFGHPIDTAQRIVGAAAHAVMHPVDTITDAVRGEVSNPTTVPMEMLQGNYRNAAGKAVGTATSMAAPELLKDVKAPIVPKVTNPNALEGEAFDFLQSKGVNVPAGPRTGNSYVKNIQKAADSTPLGSIVAHHEAAANTAALRATASDLIDTAKPPVSADTLYGQFRDAESNPANSRAVKVGTALPQMARNELDAEALAQFKQGYSSLDPAQKGAVEAAVKARGVDITPQPVVAKIPLPTDVTTIKDQIRPIYNEISKWWEPARRNASAGVQAMKSMLDGPDVVPASQAEAGLGGLKALAREGDARSAGVAKFIIPKLQQIIDDAAAQGGPDVVDSLQQARKAAAKEIAVDSLTKIFNKATAEGGFNREAGIWQDWQRARGEISKQLPASQVSDLDKFFLGAKKLAENPNPSGTSIVSISAGSGTLAVTHPMTGIPIVIGAGALSKLLHSPAAVRALTNGMKIPLKAPGSALAASQILRLAGDDAQPAVGQTSR